MSKPNSKAGRFLARQRGAYDLRADVPGSQGAQAPRCSGTPSAIRPAAPSADRDLAAARDSCASASGVHSA